MLFVWHRLAVSKFLNRSHSLLTCNPSEFLFHFHNFIPFKYLRNFAFDILQIKVHNWWVILINRHPIFSRRDYIYLCMYFYIKLKSRSFFLICKLHIFKLTKKYKPINHNSHTICLNENSCEHSFFSVIILKHKVISLNQHKYKICSKIYDSKSLIEIEVTIEIRHVISEIRITSLLFNLYS